MILRGLFVQSVHSGSIHVDAAGLFIQSFNMDTSLLQPLEGVSNCILLRYAHRMIARQVRPRKVVQRKEQGCDALLPATESAKLAPKACSTSRISRSTQGKRGSGSAWKRRNSSAVSSRSLRTYHGDHHPPERMRPLHCTASS